MISKSKSLGSFKAYVDMDDHKDKSPEYLLVKYYLEESRGLKVVSVV